MIGKLTSKIEKFKLKKKNGVLGLVLILVISILNNAMGTDHVSFYFS